MAAGVVIHALAGEQDIRKMGGLGKAPARGRIRCFLVGALALAAIPPFAGFFSKDAILASAAGAGDARLDPLGIGVTGAFLTALYTFRLVFIVFFGEPAVRPGEPPQGALRGAALDDVAGRRAHGRRDRQRVPPVPGRLGRRRHLDRARRRVDPEVSGATAWFSALFALGLALAGIVLAWFLYGRRRSDVPAPDPRPASLGRSDARAQALLRRGVRLRVLRARLALRARCSRASWRSRSSSLSLGEIAFEVRVIGASSRPRRTGSSAPTPWRWPSASPSCSSSSWP